MNKIRPLTKVINRKFNYFFLTENFTFFFKLACCVHSSSTQVYSVLCGIFTNGVPQIFDICNLCLTKGSPFLETSVANSKSYYSILVQFCPKKFNIHFLFHSKSKEAQRYRILDTIGPKLTDCFGYCLLQNCVRMETLQQWSLHILIKSRRLNVIMKPTHLKVNSFKRSGNVQALALSLSIRKTMPKAKK